MKLKIFSLLFLCISINVFAGTDKDSVIVRKTLTVSHIEVSPKIDGLLDDDVWKNAEIAKDFFQYSPQEMGPVNFPTEVKVLYNNTGIYIGAMCYDNSPDSIQKQLGLRDDYINADNFLIRIDTYNSQIDAFTFGVSASNVQNDSRLSDYNFNAVWTSAVKILPNGWSVEMEIPWSALRFPKSKEQTWGVQFARNIQRNYEYDQWCHTPKETANSMKYWGLLTGLDNIEEPIRLSLTPYISGIVEKDSRYGPAKADASIGGGLGLKYGINESFTLDMTLLPDFSQVKSDNIYKNLDPFEIQFSDQRPFFTEGTDLFDLGGIFYSRRIGKMPGGFYSASDFTTSSEKIIKNPTQSKLLNATKITGRSNTGLGIGILNAYVDNTYAIAQDTITGETRKILTEPSANYNIFVFDKQMENSSNVYVTNTNVIRSHGSRSANVTASGFSINNKKSTWNVNGDGGVSDVLEPTYTKGEYDANIGYYFRVGIRRTSGKFQYGINRQQVNRNWDCNDMGVNNQTNYSNTNADFTYNIFNPWKIINNAFFNLSFTYRDNLETQKRSSFNIDLFNYITFRNYWSVNIGADIAPIEELDYYEPRVPGRFFTHPRYRAFFGGITSNTNKQLYVSLNGDGGVTEKIGETIPANPWGGLGTEINWRVGNRFSLGIGSSFHGDYGDKGWVDIENDGTIVFGRRVLNTWENGISASFVFTRNMSVSFHARHYWETGHYQSFYVLNEDGSLTDYINYSVNHDFNFNSFNIDLNYIWNFAPGSTLSFGYKQNILSEDDVIDYSYKNNLTNTLNGPQLNQLSIQILYYLDYNYLEDRRETKHK